nr:MAG TPA: hypothetical protein [Bacteriophage sp.]
MPSHTMLRPTDLRHMAVPLPSLMQGNRNKPGYNP